MTASATPTTGAALPHPPAVDDGSAWCADCELTVHAVLPPPVTGMTLCTESAVNAVARRAPVRRYNWSNGSPRVTPWFRFVKALRALATPWKILFSSRPRHAVFYMPANAGFAILYNFLALAAARIRGYRCVLHHHYYRYVDDFEWRMKLLSHVLGPNDLQIVLCPEMERRFRALYGSALPLAVMPSMIQLLQGEAEPPPVPETAASGGAFCLGHITNLQLAKGLDLVFDVLRELRRRNCDVRLVLAGPIDTAVERGMIEAAKAEFGERLDYRGPVYGPEKRKFYQDIHVKVYPTRMDAQPLVITEAFAHGRPVISFGRGCIPGMMPCRDWSIAAESDFVEPAVRQIVRWIDDRAAYVEACQLARKQSGALLEEARTALDNFVHWVCREPDQGFVHRGAEEPFTTTPGNARNPS
jgi:glycosyltransferase involved in cell wall biosynthesis